MDQQDAAKIAAQYFSEVAYCALGTLMPDQLPWVTPVYFSTTPDLQVIWVSGINAQHSLNIQANPRIVITFFDTETPFGNAQGLYTVGSARVLSDSELQWGCQVFYSRRFPRPEDFAQKARKPEEFREPSPRRMYMCQIEQAWVLDPAGDPIYGRLLDSRIEVDLAALRSAYVPPAPPPEFKAADPRR